MAHICSSGPKPISQDFFLFTHVFEKKKSWKKRVLGPLSKCVPLRLKRSDTPSKRFGPEVKVWDIFLRFCRVFLDMLFFVFAYNLTMCCEWAVLDVTITSKHMGKTPSEMALGRSKELGCGWSFGPFFPFHGTRHELKQLKVWKCLQQVHQLCTN